MSTEPSQAAPEPPTPDPLMKALKEAAQSLRTIERLAGRGEFMEDFVQTRGYARSRAASAEAALAGAQAAIGAPTEECEPFKEPPEFTAWWSLANRPYHWTQTRLVALHAWNAALGGTGTPVEPLRLTDEQIELVAENFDAIDPKDSFWKEFARGIESEVRAVLAGIAPSIPPGPRPSSFHSTESNSTAMQRPAVPDRVMETLARSLKACGTSTADGLAIAEVFLVFWGDDK